MSCEYRLTTRDRAHGRPCAKVVAASNAYKEEHPDIEITVKNYRGAWDFGFTANAFSITGLISLNIGKGNNVGVIVDGCPESIQRECAKEIGDIIEEGYYDLVDREKAVLGVAERMDKQQGRIKK